MRTFADSRGNKWRISLPIGTVLRVRDESAGRFNLLEPSSLVDGAPLATAVQFDVPLFWELLWHLISPQARKRQIKARTFGKHMLPAHCRMARDAFTAEWLDFFRELNRPDLERQVGRMVTMRETLQATIEKQILLEMEIDQPIMAGLSQRLTKAFGAWAGSPASIPGTTPGAN